MAPQEVVISGAGPVGSLMALLLAKQGYQVQVFDKRTKPERTPDKSNTQAYLLNTNSRSLQTFREAGMSVDALVDRCGGYLRQAFKRPNGKNYHSIEMEVTRDKPAMMRVFRDEIARHIIDEAERLQPDKITFHFGEAVTKVDLHAKKVIVTGKDGEQEVPYDLLIGADGAGSVVKKAIVDISEPGFMRRRDHGNVYQTAPCNAPPGTFPKHCFMVMQALSIGALMVNGRGDGDVRIALFLPMELANKVSQGDTDIVKENIPVEGLNTHVQQALWDLLDKPGDFHPIAGWTYLSRLYGPSALLIGDAAHTMTPMLGQGCNSGLEDANLFAQFLKKNPDNLDKALKDYNAARLPDIQALLKLNEIAANERHLMLSNESAILHHFWVKSHAIMLGIHQLLGRTLQKTLPQYFGPPRLVEALKGEKPYRSVIPAIYRDTFLVFSATALFTAGVIRAAQNLHMPNVRP